MALALIVEDGTGLLAANVYDSTTACAAWLADQNMNTFSAAVADQALHLLEATRAIEARIAGLADGDPLVEDQAMLYPRSGASDARGRLYDLDERPAALREGIFLLAERRAVAAAQGERLDLVDPGGHLASHGSGGSRMSNRRERSFWELYPEVWDRISPALPAGGRRRLRRA